MFEQYFFEWETPKLDDTFLEISVLLLPWNRNSNILISTLNYTWGWGWVLLVFTLLCPLSFFFQRRNNALCFALIRPRETLMLDKDNGKIPMYVLTYVHYLAAVGLCASNNQGLSGRARIYTFINSFFFFLLDLITKKQSTAEISLVYSSVSSINLMAFLR